MLCLTHKISDTLFPENPALARRLLIQPVKFLSEIQQTRLQSRVDRIGRMLNGLIASLQPDYWDIPGNE